MKLYYGTNVDFDVIDLTKSNKYKDFVQGFYLTDIRLQAEELADALKIVYQSMTYLQLQDPEGGLYAQSPSYVYELLQKELNGICNSRE